MERSSQQLRPKDKAWILEILAMKVMWLSMANNEMSYHHRTLEQTQADHGPYCL